jgi:hypothetical protein
MVLTRGEVYSFQGGMSNARHRQKRAVQTCRAKQTVSGGPRESVAKSAFASLYPNITAWIGQDGWIELGYEPNTATCARALDEGGIAWGGGRRTESLDEWLEALESGVGGFMDEQGLR